MSDQATLYAEVMLGRDAEEFLASDLGRYILARVEEEERTAQERLAKVSPWRRNRIAELQAQIWRAQSLKSWLGELIVTGHQALSQLDAADE